MRSAVQQQNAKGGESPKAELHFAQLPTLFHNSFYSICYLMAETLTSLTSITQELASGIIQHRFEIAIENALPILLKMRAGLHCYLVVNEKRHSEQLVPGWDHAKSRDLFENAPAEIRATDSLFVAKFHLDQIDGEQLVRILASDSMILLLSDLQLPDLLEKQKIAWAWFSRPSILHQQLVHGSKTLAQTLFAGLKYAVFVDRMTTDILICGFPNIPE